MNKQLIYLIIISICIIMLLIFPTLKKDADGGKSTSPIESVEPSATAGATEIQEAIVSQSKAGSPEQLNNYPQLNVDSENIDGGFKLKIDDGSLLANSVAEDSFGDMVVHLVERQLSSLDESSAMKLRYDLVVVHPEQKDMKVYPAYIVDYGNEAISHKLKIIDDKQVMFIKRTVENGSLIYDLVIMDLEMGGVNRAFPVFWKVDLDSEEYNEDFLVSAHYAYSNDNTTSQMLLTTFLGKTWLFDFDTLKVVHGGSNMYPAYGDIGSKAPRALIYPAPNLDRFVYQFIESNQITTSNHFALVATLNREVMNTMSIDNAMALTDPGIVWNAEGTRFFQEYAESGSGKGVGFDNSYMVFAESINFYDRNGDLTRTLKPASSSGEKMNVYNWLDEERVLIETYSLLPTVVSELHKGKVIYKEYNLQSGKLTTYKNVEDITELASPKLVLLHKGQTFDSKSFVWIDQTSKRVWSPDMKGQTFSSNGQLYIQHNSEVSQMLFRWNEELKQLEWVADEIGMDLRTVSGDWLIYSERSSNNFLYKKFSVEVKQNADGFPILPLGAFDWVSSGREWWNDSRDDRVQESKEQSVRMEGRSRYGKLKLRSLTGEKSSKEVTSYMYYGDYEIEFTNVQGKRHVLGELKQLELKLASPKQNIRVIPFEGYDLLLLQTIEFPFSEIHGRSTNKLYAYVITREGQAFPLKFQYASADGMTNLDMIGIEQKGPIEIREEALIVESYVGNLPHELEWKLDIKERMFNLTSLHNRLAEYESIGRITELYSYRLGHTLGLDMADSTDEHMNEDQLRALYTESAWNNPGFQILKSDFDASAAVGEPTRAFPYQPVGARVDEYGNIRVTFAINLVNAVGVAAYLEAILKLEDYEWRFYDFGALETERTDYLQSLNGLLIKDDLVH